jgi:tetratricopeptide (TPR) repeat protein
MNTSQNTKRIISIIIAILILGGVAYAVQTNSNKKKPVDYTLDEIKALDLEKQKSILEAQVKELESRIKGFTPGNDPGPDREHEIAKYRVYIKLAEAQIELGRFQPALDALNNIPEGQKNNPPVYRAYALAYKGLSQKDKALETIKSALAEDPSNVELWLINLELNSDLPNDQFKALYLEAITKTKSNLEIMKSYAAFSERIGDKDSAIAAWETAINMDPDNTAKYQAEIDRLKK